MTVEYNHLAADYREEAMLPAHERIRRIQAERWISYPRAEVITEPVERTVALSTTRPDALSTALCVHRHG